MSELVHSIVHRPYVFAFLATHLVLGAWHVGWPRILAFTAAGYGIAWISELSSITNGFPYGAYRYDGDALASDLTVAGVPFFDSISYSFLCYFSWTVALALTQPIQRRGLDVQLAETRAGRRSPRVLVLAAALTTWLDVAVDPVARLGERWFLGPIFAYEREGLWFGVPLTNFAGWLLVSLAIVAAYQRLDALLDRVPAVGERRVFAQALLGPAVHAGVVLFVTGVALSIGEPALALTGLALHVPVWAAVARRAARAGGAARANELARTTADFPRRPLPAP